MSIFLIVKITLALLLIIPFATDVRKAVQHYKGARAAIGEYRQFKYRRAFTRIGMSMFLVLLVVIMFLLPNG